MQSNLTGKRKNDNAVHVLRRLLQFMAEQNCPFPVQGLAIAPSCTQPHRRRQTCLLCSVLIYIVLASVV